MSENKAEQKRKPHAGNFKPGVSGNPGGRPKGSGMVRELAQGYTTEAIETLLEIMRDGKNESARAAAANSMLDRGWGKPAQPLSGDDENPLFPTGISIRLVRPDSPRGT